MIIILIIVAVNQFTAVPQLYSQVHINLDTLDCIPFLSQSGRVEFKS